MVRFGEGDDTEPVALPPRLSRSVTVAPEPVLGVEDPLRRDDRPRIGRRHGQVSGLVRHDLTATARPPSSRCRLRDFTDSFQLV